MASKHTKFHYQEQNDPEKFRPDPADEDILPVNVEKNAIKLKGRSDQTTVRFPSPRRKKNYTVKMTTNPETPTKIK